MYKWMVAEIYFQDGSLEPQFEVWRFGYADIKAAERVRTKALTDFPDLNPQNIKVLQYVSE